MSNKLLIGIIAVLIGLLIAGTIFIDKIPPILSAILYVCFVAKKAIKAAYNIISRFQPMMKVYPARSIELKHIDSLGCRLFIPHK